MRCDALRTSSSFPEASMFEQREPCFHAGAMRYAPARAAAERPLGAPGACALPSPCGRGARPSPHRRLAKAWLWGAVAAGILACGCGRADGPKELAQFEVRAGHVNAVAF